MAAERGNALFLILLGIVLFAALTAAVSKGFRGSNAALSGTRIEALASDTIMTGAAIEGAVSKLLAKDNSETRISFSRASGDGYELTPAETSAEKVFNIAGGGVQYLPPAKDVLDTARSLEFPYGYWLFSGHNIVLGMGSDTRGEILAILPFVRKEICVAINAKANITNPSGNPPQDVSVADATSFYAGSFGPDEIGDSDGYLNGKKFGCFEGNLGSAHEDISGRYYFYYVLLAR